MKFCRMTLAFFTTALLSVVCGLQAGVAVSRGSTCPPTSVANGNFELLGSAQELRHYRLICNSGYNVNPPRGDTLLTCVGTRLIKRPTAQCSQGALTCLPSEFKCKRLQQCVPMRVVCDGRPDCKDKTDESSANCGVDPMLACVPQANWMNGDPNIVFHRIGGRDPKIVQYGLSCVEGYQLAARDTEDPSQDPLLSCETKRGNVSEPAVYCQEIKKDQTCVLPLEYAVKIDIVNYHSDQLDLEVDQYSVQQPGTILTVKCRETSRNNQREYIIYCGMDGKFLGLPKCD